MTDQTKTLREVTLVVDVEKLNRTMLAAHPYATVVAAHCLLDVLRMSEIEGDLVKTLDEFGIRVRKHGAPS